MTIIKAVVVDHHILVRSGVAELVRREASCEVIAEFDVCEPLLEWVRSHPTDLIIMEWCLKGGNGLDVITRLRKSYPRLKIVVLSGQLDLPFPVRLIEAGANGVLCKSVTPEEFQKGVRAVMRGDNYISHGVAQCVASTLITSKTRSPFEILSKRELQVMQMFVNGLKVYEISQRLCLSTKTVSTYRYRMFEKLGIKGEVELTHLALRYGVFEGELLSRGHGAAMVSDSLIVHH